MSAMLEIAIREHLNRTAPRRMAVLRPLKVVIENYPEGQSEELEAVNHPEDPAPARGSIRSAASSISSATISWRIRRRNSSACRPGREVRLRYAYFITCREVVKNAAGEVVELRCTYDPATRGGNAPDGRKVAGDDALGRGGAGGAGRDAPLQPAVHAAPIRAPANFVADLNPNSLEVLAGRRVEPALAGATVGRGGAVRAPGLFLPRHRFDARAPGVQPHDRACATPGRRLGTAGDRPCTHSASIVYRIMDKVLRPTSQKLPETRSPVGCSPAAIAPNAFSCARVVPTSQIASFAEVVQRRLSAAEAC